MLWFTRFLDKFLARQELLVLLACSLMIENSLVRSSLALDSQVQLRRVLMLHMMLLGKLELGSVACTAVLIMSRSAEFALLGREPNDRWGIQLVLVQTLVVCLILHGPSDRPMARLVVVQASPLVLAFRVELILE